VTRPTRSRAASGLTPRAVLALMAVLLLTGCRDRSDSEGEERVGESTQERGQPGVEEGEADFGGGSLAELMAMNRGGRSHPDDDNPIHLIFSGGYQRRGWPDVARRILDHPDIASVADLVVWDLTDAELARMLFDWIGRSPHLGNVEEMVIQRTPLDDELMVSLAMSQHLRPRALRIDGCPLTGQGVATLVESSLVERAESIRLENLPMGEAGANALASATRLGELQFLTLKGVGVSDAGAQALAGSRTMLRLVELTLCDLVDTCELLRRLLETNGLPSLRRLYTTGQVSGCRDLMDELVRARGSFEHGQSPVCER
jgi:hypothetical protein